MTLVADDDMTRSLLAAAHAPPSSSTDSASSTLVEPIPESVPIAPPFTRERTASYGHARTNSATVSSVVSSHAFPGAVTGVEVVRTLDRREKEERRAVGRGASVEPEVLEESEDEDEGWGVQSEGDLLGGRSAPMPSFASRAAEGSHSFESQRPSRPLLHARSGSFSSSPSDQPPSRRPVLMRKAYSSRRALGHRAAGSEDAGRRSASWVRAFGGAGRVDEEVEEVEEERQRVVVVEVRSLSLSRAVLR